MPFRTALSGLNAASANLRVIGNNVANASTTGFKESRAEFADVYATSSLGVASNAIGSGVRVSSISQQFSQGNIEFTDSNLDLAINGQGFFIVDDNGTNVYSRAGAFSVDRNGFVVNSNLQQLQVFQADINGNITGALGSLQLDTSDIPPNATGESTPGVGGDGISAVLNLDSNSNPIPALTVFDRNNPTTYNNSTSLTVYDSLGNPILQTMYFRKTPNPNEWQVFNWLSYTDTAGNVTEMEVPPQGGGAGTPATIQFSNLGQIASVAPAFGGSPTVIDLDTAGLLDAVGAPISLNTVTGGADLDFDLDMLGTTQFGSNFSVNSLTQDGYTSGRLRGVDIGETGVVQARYTNGQSRILGQVALANFSNPQGMRQLGDTSWAETFDSGAALIGSPGTSSLGVIQSGALEGSNTDLTEQLVSMITAQRNFQANAQVISTADTVTQTIINIR